MSLVLVSFRWLLFLFSLVFSVFLCGWSSAGSLPVPALQSEAEQSEKSDVLLFAPSGCANSGPKCLTDCRGQLDGDYQWCHGCGHFVRCRLDQLHLMRCDPYRPQWDDARKSCQLTSGTCRCASNLSGASYTRQCTTPKPRTKRTRKPTTERKTKSTAPMTSPSAQTAETTQPTATLTSEATTTGTPTGPTTERPTGPTTETPTGPTTETPTGPTTETPTESTTETPTGPTTETPTGPTTETPTGSTTETPTGPTTETPTGPTTEKPTGSTTETPTGPTTETPTGSTTQTLTGPTTETPTGSTTETPTGSTTETPTGPTTETPTGSTTETPTGPTTETPTGSTTETPTGPTTETPTGPTTETPRTKRTRRPRTTMTTKSTAPMTSPSAQTAETTQPTATLTSEATTTETPTGPTTETPTGPTTETPTGPTTETPTKPTTETPTGPTTEIPTGPTTETPTESTTETPTGPTTETPTEATTEPATGTTIVPTTETSAGTITENVTATILPPTTTPGTTINPVDKDQYRQGTVYINPMNGRLTYRLGVMDRNFGACIGYYNNSIHANGWGVLDIQTIPSAIPSNHRGSLPLGSNRLMYAAGFLEGILTARQIYNQYVNLRPFFFRGREDQKKEFVIRRFLEKQDRWTREKVRINRIFRNPYWINVELILNQFDGLYDGYRTIASNEGWDTDVFVIQMLNAVGDLLDIQQALLPPTRPSFRNMTDGELRQYLATNGRCSALIKLTPGFENVYIGHSSWFTYAATLRIYKHFHFTHIHLLSASQRVSFSSYPGMLVSLDDFYLLDSRLAMVQTTNSIIETSLLDKVVPQSLLAWQRVLLANRMARSGKEWYDAFRQYNSGTYNNQYMVIDLNKISLGKGVEDGALWVIEQIPRLVIGRDQTSILRAGYWPSYNIPFYEEIFRLSGYQMLVDLFGPDFSYQLAPRAKIFRRDSGKVTDLTSFQNIIRDNDFKNDNYSKNNSLNAICARGDLLNVSHAKAFGCYDGKVTDYAMAIRLTSLAISGPTTSHGLPPFEWTGAFVESHVGLPQEYNFSWVPMESTLL